MVEFKDISSNPLSANEISVPFTLVPVVVLIFAPIDVVSGNNVCMFGLILLNVIFCVAFGPLKDPTVGVEEYVPPDLVCLKNNSAYELVFPVLLSAPEFA